MKFNNSFNTYIDNCQILFSPKNLEFNKILKSLFETDQVEETKNFW